MKNDKMGSKVEIKLKSVEPLSPHNEALYETGKGMLKSSVSTARDFCKFMITVSTGAIPVYLGLLEFVLPENVVLPTGKLVLSVIPPFLFLASTVLFIMGYFPQVEYFSLDIIEETKTAYENTIMRRKKFINSGISVFLIGSIFGIISVVIHIVG